MRIMIVEDEEALALGLKFNFEQEGYEVLLASDGQTALKLFQTSSPPIDLVILDLMLPGMSGYEICSSIRATNKLVPIIILSARSLAEDRMHAFDVGTDQYITKPFALPELLNRVKNSMERCRTLRTDHLSSNSQDSSPGNVHEFGNIKVDFGAFEVHVGDKIHSLTTLEMHLPDFAASDVILNEHHAVVRPFYKALMNIQP